MEFYAIVRPEHLNQFNYLFGGSMLKWVDEFAYMAAIREFPGSRFVTRAMDSVSFTRSVNNGDMLRFAVNRERQGKTSLGYRVIVFARALHEKKENHVFETTVTLVAINSQGQKEKLPESNAPKL